MDGLDLRDGLEQKNLAICLTKEETPMAEHMSEMKKEYVDGLSTLPAADDQAAINTVVLDFLDFMFTKGFEKADIEQQLGDTRTAL